MKNVIVILFTVILGVYIGSTFIMGSGGNDTETSFLDVAEGVGTKTTSQLKTITDTAVFK